MEGIRIQETCYCLFKLFDIIIQVLGMGRKIVKGLGAKIVDPFLICCQIWGRLEFCLVFMLWISEFILYWSLLLTTNRRSESMYCDWRGKILSLLDKSLWVSTSATHNNSNYILLYPKIFTLYEEFPQNINPYIILDCRYGK